MNGIVGLSALAGYQVQIDTDAQADPEHRLGGPADPRHGIVGEQATPYPWQSNSMQAGGHGPYGPQNQLLGEFDDWFLTPAGHVEDDPTFDRTPSRRAAPKPKGILSGPIRGDDPDAIAEQLRQSYAIHGVNSGAGLKPMTAMSPQQDHWEELLLTNEGHSDQVTIPKQMMSSGFMFGTRDRVQSMARQNEHGFDSSHMHRRYATGAIPGNYMYLRPGGRPMMKTLPGPARPPIGRNSPFAGNDLGIAFSPNGAVLQNVPTEYVAPPTPNLAAAPSVDSYQDSVVEWY